MSRLNFLAFILTILISGVTFAAEQPWLMAFPQIAHDANRVCFSNPEWTAYYSLEKRAMYSVPTDSITLPPRRIHTNSVMLGEEMLSCEGVRLERVRIPGLPQEYELPTLSEASAVPLLDGWSKKSVSISAIRETMGPLGVSGTTLWFGLTANGGPGLSAAGLGWFDTEREIFGRIYAPSLAHNKPLWIDIVRDTVVVVVEEHKDRRLHLVAYAIQTAELSELDWRAAGVPGDRILSVDHWQDFLLLSTDQAVAIWAPGHQPNVWTTRAYAAKQPVRLKMLKFVNGRPDSTSMQDFLPMLENRPSEIMAQIGDLVEIVAHAGVEGFVDKKVWDRSGASWKSVDWGCERPCFARVRVPSRGRFIEGDLWNTPITFIENTPDGVKVGFTAGWTNIDYLTPALIPYP